MEDRFCFAKEHSEISQILQKNNLDESSAFHEATQLLSMPTEELLIHPWLTVDLIKIIRKKHEKLDFLEIDRGSAFINSRYDWIKLVCDISVKKKFTEIKNLSDKVDRILTHKFFGFIFFFGIMTFMFQIMFSWVTIPMNWINLFFNFLGTEISKILPSGQIESLVVDGIIGGVGAVISFLPQIVFLFLFLGILEDSGYMARAAFIMDKVMSKVGLHGKSFIPLLSSFACAIPGIMATRTIENEKDRITTMMIAPLMSCSARIPVYTLMIGAFIPNNSIFGIISLPALILVSLYMLGLLAALVFGFIFKKLY